MDDGQRPECCLTVGGKLDPRLGSLAGVKGLKAADENEASWDCIGCLHDTNLLMLLWPRAV